MKQRAKFGNKKTPLDHDVSAKEASLGSKTGVPTQNDTEASRSRMHRRLSARGVEVPRRGMNRPNDLEA